MIKILGIVALVLRALFFISFVIYFWNLDMKLVAKITPFLSGHYDKIKREKML